MWRLRKATRSDMSWTSIKNLAIYSIYSLVVALIIVEVILRVIPPIPSSIGGGIGRAWNEKNWHPINEQGFRDLEVVLNPTKELLVFVGDSFTAGYGVSFENTYSSALREKLSKGYDVVNLGANGTATSQQRMNYVNFIRSFQKAPSDVVYQYFGNDIDDFVNPSECYSDNSNFSKFLLEVSFLYGLFDVIFVQKDSSSCYQDKLEAAYRDDVRSKDHKSQVEEFARLIQSLNSNIIFVAFPFLNNETLLAESQSLYIESLKRLFQNYCKKGDWFYDASNAALSLKTSDRVASFMDAHPSKALHELISKDIGKLVLNVSDADRVSGAYRCKS